MRSEKKDLKNRKICIVTDSHVAPLYHEAVKSALQEISSEIFSFVFEAGEKNKNPEYSTGNYIKL